MTINNYKKHLGEGDLAFYVEEIIKRLKNVSYVIIGLEVGKEGTEHIQGYFEVPNPRVVGGLSKALKCAHLEPRNGTRDQAITYCKKDGKFLEWYATPDQPPPGQGARTDLKELVSAIRDGLKVDDIVIENPAIYHQYGRTFNKVEDLAMRRKYRTEMTTCIWYWGPTGVGKSHVAFDGYSPTTHYVYPNDNGWWDGYAQQEVVILNDFRGEIPYNEMLQMIDKYPHWVRRRGREPLPFTTKHVIVTSALPPNYVYQMQHTQDSIAQLLRRVHVVHLNEFYIDENLGTELKSSEGNSSNKLQEEPSEIQPPTADNPPAAENGYPRLDSYVG